MKKLLFILLSVWGIASASPPLLLKPNVATIDVVGMPSDTAIHLQRLYLVERVIYNAEDSSAKIYFTAYVNQKEFVKRNSVTTNVPMFAPEFKVASGSSASIPSLLQVARLYYISLGYTAFIQ